MKKNGDSLTQVIQLERTDIMTVKKDLPLIRIVEPRDELQNRALPGAVCANDDLSHGNQFHIHRKVIFNEGSSVRRDFLDPT